MYVLIDDLKKEHALVLEMLENAKNYGILSKNGQDSLISIKENLVAHLDKEEHELYPYLEKYAEKNEDFLETLKFFEKKMNYIADYARSFFDKYIGVEEELNFFTDFSVFFGLVKQRIRDEEEVIFKKYEELLKEDELSAESGF